MDAHTDLARVEVLAQRWEAARTREDFHAVLHELTQWFQEQHSIYAAMSNRYSAMVESLTETVTRLTAAVEDLTAQRQTLIQAAADAYEAGCNEYLAYTNAFLADHADQWEAYIRAYGGLVIDPDALAAIDPRPRDTAVRLCHACRNGLDFGIDAGSHQDTSVP